MELYISLWPLCHAAKSLQWPWKIIEEEEEEWAEEEEEECQNVLNIVNPSRGSSRGFLLICKMDDSSSIIDRVLEHLWYLLRRQQSIVYVGIFAQINTTFYFEDTQEVTNRESQWSPSWPQLASNKSELQQIEQWEIVHIECHLEDDNMC